MISDRRSPAAQRRVAAHAAWLLHNARAADARHATDDTAADLDAAQAWADWTTDREYGR